MCSTDRSCCQPTDGLSRYGNVLDKASQYIIRLLNDAHRKENGGPIDPFPIFFQGAVVLAVTILCGASVEEASTVLKDIPFPMKRIGEYVTLACSSKTNYIVARIDSRVRNINGHWRDFFPLLRWLPDSKLSREAVVVAKYRNKKLDWMLDRARSYAAVGINQPCAARTILSENKLVGLSDDALSSVINSMVSSGLGKCPSNSPIDGGSSCDFSCPSRRSHAQHLLVGSRDPRFTEGYPGKGPRCRPPPG